MTRRSGTVSAETKERLLKAATEEFAACGYSGSSLRSICERAEVTTGALYFFFDNKDDLFREVVETVAAPLREGVSWHYRQEMAELKHQAEQYRHMPEDQTFQYMKEMFMDDKDDVKAFQTIVHFFYQNPEITAVIINDQGHPAVKSMFDEIIDMTTKQYMEVFALFGIPEKNKDVKDPFTIHLLTHALVESTVTLLTHNFTEEEAIEHARVIVKILRGGFFNLFVS